MKCTLTPLKYPVLIVCFFSSFMSYAFDSTVTEKQADSSIKELYHRLGNMPNSSLSGRIEWISSQFLGVRYLLGSLGEGPKARYDQFPRYRVDAFDCDTYVNTVLSLALANSLPSFKKCINNLRYKNNKVSYLERNHFTGIDWNQYNQQNKVFKDITLTIKNKKNHPIAQFAEAVINKPNWYAYKTIETIRLENEDLEKSKELLEELKRKGSQLEVAIEKVPYLPLTALFPQKDIPDEYLFAQIPHGAIIEIVRPNWDLSQKIGTALNISHLGFAIRKKNQLYFREASSEYNKVVDVPLIEYLEKAQTSPTIKGINVQVVLPYKSINKCSK